MLPFPLVFNSFSINTPPLPSFLANDEVYLLLPPGIDNVVVPVFVNEPSSIIAHALVSKQYHQELEKRIHLKQQNTTNLGGIKLNLGSNY